MKMYIVNAQFCHIVRYIQSKNVTIVFHYFVPWLSIQRNGLKSMSLTQALRKGIDSLAHFFSYFQWIQNELLFKVLSYSAMLVSIK